MNEAIARGSDSGARRPGGAHGARRPARLRLLPDLAAVALARAGGREVATHRDSAARERIGLATAIRWGALFLVCMDIVAGHAPLRALGATGLLVAYSAARSVAPIRSARAGATNRLAVGTETALCLGAVIWSGGWSSPLVLMLGVAMFLGGMTAGAAGTVVGMSVLGAGSISWLLVASGGVGLALTLERIVTMAVVSGVGAYARELGLREQRRSAADERGKITRQLHDGLAQAVAAIGLEVDRLASEWSRGFPGALPEVEEALWRLASELTTVNRQVRGELRDLRGAPSARRVLVPAVTELLEAVERRSHVSTTFRHDQSVTLAAELEDELSQIAREAILNAERHAGSSSISVRFEAGPERVILEVLDDGRGLGDADGGGFGIVGMRERASALGGQLYVGDNGTLGTAVRLRLERVAA